jgi:GNAT superfamily N-acetyltransferase
MEEICLLKNPIKETRVEIETDSSFLHLRSFLFEDADNYIQEQIASVYWLYIDDELRWYMSLSVSVCKVDDEYWQNKIWDWESPKFPWLLIGRLLIDGRLQWRWYGKKFVAIAVSIGNELSKLAWLRCLIVDANIDAIVFYEKMGFIEISWTKNKETVKMILDLKEFYV